MVQCTRQKLVKKLLRLGWTEKIANEYIDWMKIHNIIELKEDANGNNQ